MRITQGHQHKIAIIEKCLDEELHSDLEEFVIQEFTNDLLGEDLLNAARALRSTKTVIFLTTLAVANLANPGDRAMWLVCYQSIVNSIESEGFKTLPEDLPTKWVTRRIIGTDTQGVDKCNGTSVDWLDAIELAIDQTNLSLLEQLVSEFANRESGSEIWLAIAKTLMDRKRFFTMHKELGHFASSYEIIRKKLLLDPDSETICSTLASYSARNYLKAGDTQRAKKIASQVQAINFQYELEFRSIMAEACCKSGELAESVYWVDQAIQVALRSEVLDWFALEAQKKNEKELEKPGFTPENAGKALIALQNTLEISGHKMFLVSGTLLGYAREGKLLSHDKDIDVGVLGWVNQFDVINALIQSRKFVMGDLNFEHDETHVIPLQHIETNTAIDVFFYRQVGDKYVTGVRSIFGYLQKFSFTPFELKTIDFLGEELYAPADIDLNLRENYGEGWKISDSGYLSHLESPSTVDPGGLVFQLVARLNLYAALYRGKKEKFLRVLNILDQYQSHPAGISPSLLGQLQDVAERIGDAPQVARQESSTIFKLPNIGASIDKFLSQRREQSAEV